MRINDKCLRIIYEFIQEYFMLYIKEAFYRNYCLINILIIVKNITDDIFY